MNNLGTHNTERLKLFKGLSVTCSTMIESQMNKVSNMIIDMGGDFHIDFPKTTNVLVIDVQNLTGYEALLKSMKYKYVIEKKIDTVIIDFECLQHIYSLFKTNDINKIHPILKAGGRASNIKNDEFLKHIVLNLLRVKYAVKPFDLLKNKVKIFFGKYKNQEDIAAYVSSIKENMSDTNFVNLDIKENCYMTQLDDAARDKCLFITELNYGARLDAAKKDRIPVIHVQWLIDILKRKLMLSYKPYLLNNIATKSTREINDIMKANRSWKNLELSMLEKDIDLAKQVFDEYEIIDNKVIIKKNLKSKLDNTIWDKIMCTENSNISRTKNAESTDLSGLSASNASMLKMKIDSSARQESILPPATQHDYFKNSHIKTFGFSEKHNKILERTFKKSQCITFRSYHDEENHPSGISELVSDFSKLEYDFTSGRQCIIVIPYNYDLSRLPYFLAEKYMETLGYFQRGTVNWNEINAFVVTEFYLERCLFYKKTILPDAWSIPFYNSGLSLKHYKNSSESTDDYLWTTTGFEGVEFLHLNKIINLFDSLKKQTNFMFSQNLNNKTDLLVVNLTKLMVMNASKNGPLYAESNRYLSLFKEEEKKITFEKPSYGGDTVDSNKFLLKKLNFIRSSKKSIASVTPGFLFELFHKFNLMTLDSSKSINESALRINDKLWCITCPQTDIKSVTDIDKDNTNFTENYERYLFIIEATNKHVDSYSRKRKLVHTTVPDLPSKKNLNAFSRPESLDISPNKKLNQSSFEKEKVSDSWRNKFLNGSSSPLKNKSTKPNASPIKYIQENNAIETNGLGVALESPEKDVEVNLAEGDMEVNSENSAKLHSQITYGFGKAGNSDRYHNIEDKHSRNRRRITRQYTKNFAQINNCDI